MNFIGKVCPYCQTEFKEGDDIVVCSVCEMPHHKECWIENKACTTFGCTGTIVGADQYAESTEKGNYCSKCGAAMEEDQKFCSACGSPVGASGEPHFKPSGSSVSTAAGTPQSNVPPVYTPPQYTRPPQYNNSYSGGYTASSSQNSAQNSTQDDPDLSAFIGSNQPTYIDKFNRMSIANSATSWNWCAFLFGTNWFVYRKMYGIAAAYYGISFVLSFIPHLGRLLSIALSICAGIFGNYFYKQHVDSELRVAKSMDDYNKAAYIAKKGGTSVPALIIVLVIIFIINMILQGL